DGRVRGAATALGDDAGRHLHDRFPVGIGAFGDEDLALLEARELGWARDHPRASDGDAFAYREALGERLSLAGQAIDAERLLLAVGVYRLGTRLQHEQLARLAVLAPLDVHRRIAAALRRVVLLDADRPAGEFQHFLVGERGTGAHLLGNRLQGDELAAGRSVDHPLLLAPHRAPDQRGEALAERRLVYVELVGNDLPLHHRFAETVARG